MPASQASASAASAQRRRISPRHAGYALFFLSLAVSIWTQDPLAFMLFVLALLLYVFLGVGEWRGQRDR